MAVANPLLHFDRKHLQLRGLGVVVVAMVVTAVGIALGLRWPFRESAVIQSLQDASSSQVTIRNFRGVYFPHPGCVAEQVTFRREPSDPNTPPLISVRKLTVEGSFLGVITKHVRLIRANGMQVFIPAETTNRRSRASSNVTVDEFTANDATLQFGSRMPGKPPTEFAIHESTFRNIGGPGRILFHAKLSNPEPPGEIDTNGSFGPWKPGDPLQSPISGKYSFQHADLAVFKGIAGILSSAGKFQGVLERIAVQGTTDVPDFKVTSSRHQVRLRTQFKAFVNAGTGDVFLDEVDSGFGRTTILTVGSVAREAGQKGRFTELNIQAKDGRIQDLFELFIKERRSPIAGVTNFRAHVMLPPKKHPFFKKVQLNGDFGIEAGEFTRSITQQDVDKLSAESRGQKDDNPEAVLSGLKGHVELADGIATFSNLSFGVPGALAQMHGTYDLISEKVDLHGILKMDAAISHMAHGPKAVLLKLMDPFFKREPRGSEVPVKITGTYQHPSFGLELSGRKRNRNARELERLYESRKK
jgi:AsmA-like C-terminal region